MLKSGISVFLEYRTSFIPTEHAKNIAGTMDRALSHVLASSDVLVNRANFMSERNRSQIERWNSKPLEPDLRTIHGMIADVAAKLPNHEAVCAWDGNFTYEQLHQYASKLASYLILQGVGPDVIVPLCFEKTKWNVVAMLGVLIAGGACKCSLPLLQIMSSSLFPSQRTSPLKYYMPYMLNELFFTCLNCYYKRLTHILVLPLDPTVPRERIQHLVNASNARIVLCSLRHMETLQAVAEIIAPVDPDFLDNLPEVSQHQQSTATSDNLAYIIPTSGTTGQPKLTCIEHGNYCTNVKGHVPGIKVDAVKPIRVLQFATHSFDASIIEILTPLMIGGTTCIPDEHARLNDVAKVINDMRVTWASLTPTFVRFLEPSMVPTLASIVLMGEAMSQANLDTWSQINLINGYANFPTFAYLVC